jgi:hypothetical protein
MLAQSVHDASWAALVSKIAYKAENLQWPTMQSILRHADVSTALAHYVRGSHERLCRRMIGKHRRPSGNVAAMTRP